MSKLAIIQDAEKLAIHLSLTMKQYKTVGERLHIGVVSAIWHACQHGNPALLNKVYEGLRSNDQTAMKLYVRRIHAVNGLADNGSPEGLPAEMVADAITKGAVFGMEKGQFTVIAGHTSDQAKSLAALCEKRFIDPDGEIDRMVFDRNNFAEVKTLGDEEVVEALLKIVKATESNTETKVHSLTDSMKAFVTSLKDQLETRKQQLSLNEG